MASTSISISTSTSISPVLHNPNSHRRPSLSSFASSTPPPSPISLSLSLVAGSTDRRRFRPIPPSRAVLPIVAGAVNREPLKVMISGAPASGKGTQCEFIAHKQYGLVHVSAGDLLRAEIAAGTENGKRAKQYMEKGQLVPDEIVVTMVKERLFQPDVQENGWLLDGYPRSLSQAKALEDLGIRPDIFLVLDVPEEVLVERVVGRRLDPVTGKIYHVKYFPPETEEIASRLTQRFDDTEEKVKLRLVTYHQNVESVISTYQDLIYKVNGNVTKEEVFAQIDGALTNILEQKQLANASVANTA